MRSTKQKKSQPAQQIDGVKDFYRQIAIKIACGYSQATRHTDCRNNVLPLQCDCVPYRSNSNANVVKSIRSIYSIGARFRRSTKGVQLLAFNLDSICKRVKYNAQQFLFCLSSIFVAIEFPIENLLKTFFSFVVVIVIW